MKNTLALGIVSTVLMAGNGSAAPLRVGSECTYPPFNYRDAQGELQGFDIDIAREVAKRSGHEIEFVCQAWEGIIPALLAGKFDLIVASMSITDERKKSIDFSIPYRSSSARFVGKKGLGAEPFTAEGQPNPQGIAGKAIAIQRSSTYERYISDKFAGANIVQYDAVDNMLLDLQSGRVDLMFAGPIKLSGDFLEKPEGKDFEFVGPEINEVSYFGPGIGIGVRKEDVTVLKEVDAALGAMIKDGTFKTINQKYWSFSVLPSAW